MVVNTSIMYKNFYTTDAIGSHIAIDCSKLHHACMELLLITCIRVCVFVHAYVRVCVRGCVM